MSRVLFLTLGAVFVPSLAQDALSLIQHDAMRLETSHSGLSHGAWTKMAKVLDMDLFMLDEAESKSRGALCLDGSTPGYYHKPGTKDGKWLFWFNGGGVCVNKTDCEDYLPIHDFAMQASEYPLLKYGEFADYHHVLLLNCDLGHYLGDRDEPVVQNGQKLYSQGSRIVKHVVDVLSANYTMTDVLLSGGSGGGFALFIGADYFQSIMPSTVSKFAIAPVNGWFRQYDSDSLRQIHEMHGFQNTMSENCKNSVSAEEVHLCIDPPTAYGYIKPAVFMVQFYDCTWLPQDDRSDSSFAQAWSHCLKYEDEQCDDENAGIAQETFDNFTSLLKTYSKYSQNGMGGWLSTCARHLFYKYDEEFSQYTTEGVTAGEAIETWWKRIDTNPASKWYLPCDLGEAPHVQCENTCKGAYEIFGEDEDLVLKPGRK